MYVTSSKLTYWEYAAAMRLRQLGTTQSVTFFAPPEVYQSIIDLQMKPLGAKIDSRDV